MSSLDVIVTFGKDIPLEIQGSALLNLEKNLRQTGLDIRVFKDKMGDDSKLRIKMTVEERNSI